MRIDIYTSPTCGYCHQAKRFLSERGVEYVEYDVSRDQDAGERMVNLTGQTGVPVIVIDGQAVVGFDHARLENLLGGPGNRPTLRVGLKVTDAKRYTAQPGAYIGVVEPGSVAARAGLRQGDVIVGIDSNPITSADDLVRAFSIINRGARAPVVFVRDERSMQTQIAM